ITIIVVLILFAKLWLPASQIESDFFIWKPEEAPVSAVSVSPLRRLHSNTFMSEGRDAQYDPYIPSGGNNAGAGAPGNQRTAALQAQIDDTVGVMRENINKVSQRGERLDSLQDKTDNLAESAMGFRRGANRVRKQMWWADMRMRMCLIAGIIILLLVIIIPAERKWYNVTNENFAGT
ncbi:hypothetical protein DH86_00001909, partial [Scytalidium sp. 3C]